MDCPKVHGPNQLALQGAGGHGVNHMSWTAPATATYTVSMEALADRSHGTFLISVSTVDSAGGDGAGDPCNGGLSLNSRSSTISFDDTGVLTATCDWVIHCAGNDGITFTFEGLQTESNFDFVTVFDGSSADSPQLAHVSGVRIPGQATYHTSSHQMLVEYTSDGSVNGGGFEGSYNCGPATSVGLTALQAIVVGTPISGSIEPAPAPNPRYSLTAVGGTTYQVSCTLAGLTDSVLELYAPNGLDQVSRGLQLQSLWRIHTAAVS